MSKSETFLKEFFKTIAFFIVCFSFISSYIPFINELKYKIIDINKIPNDYHTLIICLVFTIIFDCINDKESDNIKYPKILWIIQIMISVVLFPMVLVFRNDLFKLLISAFAMIYSIISIGIRGYVFLQYLCYYRGIRRRIK
jgi:uncharacterized protein YacL